MKKTLVGVSASKQFLPDAISILDGMISPGVKVGVEYTKKHFERSPRTIQDKFWKSLITYLKKKRCRVVFLDSVKLREHLDNKMKRNTLSLEDAKIMFGEREKVFMRKIPVCQVSVLGAAHAINLSKQAKAGLVLDFFSSKARARKAIALTPEQLMAFRERRKRGKKPDALRDSWIKLREKEKSKSSKRKPRIKRPK